MFMIFYRLTNNKEETPRESEREGVGKSDDWSKLVSNNDAWRDIE